MMILRPYQYFTTEAIIHQVKTLTTTLTFGTPQVRKTSFNASQIVMELPDVYKVVLVDRKDLITKP
jgi:type I restriction enzyme R subunit